MAEDMRKETDTMGVIDVPEEKYWGAQTQRALHNFKISTETIPPSLIRAFANLKKAAATVNADLGLLDRDIANTISAVCDEIIAGDHNDNFPLSVWQTGSGTQTNMNMNEVIANRAIEVLGGVMGSKEPVHPNDHVNLGQSSNDTFPTAMHIAAVESLEKRVLPSLQKMHEELESKSNAFKHIIKVGRTHMQDAVPITLGQEFSGYSRQMALSIERVRAVLPNLRELAIGGTAVGTGLNTHPDFGRRVAEELSKNLGTHFTSAENKFETLAAHDSLVYASGALKSTATAMTKIAGDIRLMGSGPRCGLGELLLPQNEPGSSIMPGKVNPTQVEALTMACAQVFGNDVTITHAGASGHLELNVYKPVMIFSFLQSCRLIGDSAKNFTKNCLAGLGPNRQQISTYLKNTLMLVTALNPHIGYDKAASVAKKAYAENITLKEAAIALAYMDEQTFEQATRPEKMISPQKKFRSTKS